MVFIPIIVLISGAFNSGIPGIQTNMQSTQYSTPQLIPNGSQVDQNIKLVTEVVADYHEEHTYYENDTFVCGDMAIDVWDILKTKGINAKIEVGNVKQSILRIDDANHAWIMAEVAPNQWLALETTGGYSVTKDQNSLYYSGWTFGNPKEFKDFLDQRKHPCGTGYVLGNDNLCHLACGGNTYCPDNSACFNGKCVGCNPGYALGNDLQCHQECGSTGNNCQIGTCDNENCVMSPISKESEMEKMPLVILD